MKKHSCWLEMDDGTEIFVQKWIDPTIEPIAIIQVSHGMAEHSDRYHDFAAFLVAHGIFLYANDHRGHGHTAGRHGTHGYFADEQGFDRVTNDLVEITNHIKVEFPDTPVILFGHSLGSFLARHYMHNYSHLVDGVILSGTASYTKIELLVGRLLAKLEIKRRGKKEKSPLLTRITFMGNTKHIADASTKSDWLTRDKEQVQRYIDDPNCGFTATAGFYDDLFSGLFTIHNRHHISNIPKNLPILFISGTDDPVGKLGVGVQKVINQYQALNVGKITSHLYVGGRHEMLNETNKEEVFQDIFDWVNSTV